MRKEALRYRRLKAERRRERKHAMIGKMGVKATACARKVRYETVEDAQMSAFRAFEKRGVELRMYQCKYCGGWHLTKHTREERAESIRVLLDGKVRRGVGD